MEDRTLEQWNNKTFDSLFHPKGNMPRFLHFNVLFSPTTLRFALSPSCCVFSCKSVDSATRRSTTISKVQSCTNSSWAVADPYLPRLNGHVSGCETALNRATRRCLGKRKAKQTDREEAIVGSRRISHLVLVLYSSNKRSYFSIGVSFEHTSDGLVLCIFRCLFQHASFLKDLSFPLCSVSSHHLGRHFHLRR